MPGSIDYSNDDRVIRMPDLEYTPDPRGLGYVLYSSMKKYKENIAQIDGVTGEKDLYKSLLQRCTRVAIKLQSMDVTNNDIVSICTFNHLNAFVPYLATLFIGAKVCLLNPKLNVGDAVHIINQVTPKIIFVSTESVSLIETVIAKIKKNVKIIVFERSDKYTFVDELLKPNPNETNFEPHKVQSLQETCVIFCTSGTTGLPKCACIHHYGFLSQLANNINFGMCEDISFVFSPFHWVTACFYACSVILQGKIRLVIPRFDSTIVWNAIDKFKPTFILAAPFHYMTLYHAKPPNVDTSDLVHIVVGGGTLYEPQLRCIQEMFPSAAVIAGYGQTEMCVILTIFKPSDPRDCKLAKLKPTSCGTGISGIWYKIVDVDTEELLGPNQTGELRLKTKFHLNGYYNLDSSHLWDKDGWYKTGDLVYYDEDKCFYIVNRINEYLKFQSWYIPPASLENILNAHPNVASSLIIGIPHEVDENHLMALVVLKNNSLKITEKDIETYIEERVDDIKRLRGGVKIVDAIPTDSNGKIKRRDIVNMVLLGKL